MRSYQLLLAFAASAAASPACQPNRVCNADNCLRAIRNTARPGLADCSSFLTATVTPATSTVYDTLTFTTTPTLTFEVTNTITNLATATEVLEQTTTQTVTTQGGTILPGVQAGKRQATEILPSIPRHATACSGSVRYTSACDCLGAGSPTTVTVAAPTTTVTLSETVTPTIISEYITVKTEEITITDATVTNTVVETATATVVETATVTPFHVRVVGGPRHDGQYIRHQVWSFREMLMIAPGKDPNGLFYLDAEGVLKVVSGPHFGYLPSENTHWSLISNFAVNTERLKCHITPDSRLKCAHDGAPNSALVNCSYWASIFVMLWGGSLPQDADRCYFLDLLVEPQVA